MGFPPILGHFLLTLMRFGAKFRCHVSPRSLRPRIGHPGRHHHPRHSPSEGCRHVPGPTAARPDAEWLPDRARQASVAPSRSECEPSRRRSPQPSAVSRQPSVSQSAVSRQPSAVSRQPSAGSRRRCRRRSSSERAPASRFADAVWTRTAQGAARAGDQRPQTDSRAAHSFKLNRQ